MEAVDKELKKVGKSGLLPAGAVITGSGANLDGLVEVAKRCLRLPAVLGYPQELISNIDKVSETAFTTAVGLVLWGSQLETKRGGFNKFLPGWTGGGKAVDNVRQWVKSLLPS
jgi:cell division protein FtsA